MEKTFRTLSEAGIVWLYRPGVSYTTKIGKWTITVRRATTINKRNWRLFVSPVGGGIGLSFGCQFHSTPKSARARGVRLAREAK